MDIYALVGKSGTGKSHNVYNLSRKLKTDYIIDDGILIKNNSLVGGVSAKGEDSRIKAVKRAIFFCDKHRKIIKDLLEREKPKRLLIVGTSKKMIKKIIDRLKLNTVSEYIYIDMISSKENIEKALEIRKNHGKHLIPIPNFEIEKDFSGYFMEKFVGKKIDISNDFYEGTVVRPTFSYMGKYTIKDKVIKDIIVFLSIREKSIHKVKRIIVEGKNGGIYLFIDLIIYYPNNIKDAVKSFEKTIYSEISWMTGIYIERICFNVLGLKVEKNLA